MIWKDLIINDILTLYRISEYGHVYSLRKRKILKGGTLGLPGYEYKAQRLEFKPGHFKTFSIHRLVYQTFVGPIPKGMEINHKDLNKANNHYSNLEVLTHRDNIIHARIKKEWESGRKLGYKHNEATKAKMSRAKQKPVRLMEDYTQAIDFQSIEEAAQYLNTYRKKITRAIATGSTFRLEDHSYIASYL